MSGLRILLRTFLFLTPFILPHFTNAADFSPEQMRSLLNQIFKVTDWDHQILVMTDLPRSDAESNPRWKERIEIAKDWTKAIQSAFPEKKVFLAEYLSVGAHGANLPEDVSIEGKLLNLEALLSRTQIVISVTEYSATPPLRKFLEKLKSFRAITMPSFARDMIPAMFLDYAEVAKRTSTLKSLLQKTDEVRMTFDVHGESYMFRADMRDSKILEDNGIVHDLGVLSNFPAGETFATPNENSNSRTEGILPVEMKGEVVLYKIKSNRAIDVISTGPISMAEKAYLRSEPAYGNIAEIGLGVLGSFGVSAIGRENSVLLDEKLGLHIAFGRSDHFGGLVGPEKFKHKVVHMDRVYVSEMQPHVKVTSARLILKSTIATGSQVLLIKDGQFLNRIFCAQKLSELITH